MKKIFLILGGFASLCLLLSSIFQVETWSQTSLYQNVKVVNRQLMVDFDQDGTYEPYFIKGVGYNPVPVGRYNMDWGYADPNDPRPNNLLDDTDILNRDLDWLQAMNANTIRIWKGNNTQVTLADVENPNSPRYQDWASIGKDTNFITLQTLDLAELRNIKVVAGFSMLWPGTWQYPQGQYIQYTDYTDPNVRNDLLTKFENYVTAYKDHPAILFWAIGNEQNVAFNDQTPEGQAQITAYYSLVNELAQHARQIEGAAYHPVAIVNGDLGYINDPQYGTTDADLTYVDIWGANVYRGHPDSGITLGNIFEEFAVKSNKAFWVSEFGIDAWHSIDVFNPDKGFEDQVSQATIDGQLFDEIRAAYASQKTIGATVMEYSDEWWKPYQWLCGIDSGACNAAQNHFGTGPLDFTRPADGTIDWTPSAPDSFFNEEWWGIMAIEQNSTAYSPDIMIPRDVYTTLQSKFALSIDPPVFTPALDQTVIPGSTLAFDVSANDVDGDTITLSARLSNGALLSTIGAGFGDCGTGNGIFTWTPSNLQIGRYTIIFEALDSTGLKSTMTVTVKVEGTTIGNASL